MHNYLLALQEKDYDRAYRCLSTSLEGYPEPSINSPATSTTMNMPLPSANGP